MLGEVDQGRQYRARAQCKGYEEHPGGDGEGLEDGGPLLDGQGFGRHPVDVLRHVVIGEVDGILPLESLFMWWSNRI